MPEAEPQCAVTEITVGDRRVKLMERYPGQLAGPNGVISEETRRAVEVYLEAAERRFQ